MNKTKLLGWLGIVAGFVSLISVLFINENTRVRFARYPLIVVGIMLLAAGMQSIRNLKDK